MANYIENLAPVTRVGLDLAKNVFQVHGVDASGRVIVVRKLRRAAALPFFGRLQPCVVAMEAQRAPTIGAVRSRRSDTK